MRLGAVVVVLAAVTAAGVSCRSKEPNQPPPPHPQDAQPAATQTKSQASAPAIETTTAPAPATPSDIEPPPAALELTAELPGEEFYAGDPLPVTLRLVSPRTRRQAYRPAATTQAAAPPALPADWPKIAPDWQKAVRFTLLAVGPDSRQQPLDKQIDWPKLLLADSPTDRIGSPAAVWLVPPETNLPPGRYLLQAAWDGRGLALPADLPSDGLLPAELEFELIEPRTNAQKAVHLQRLAEFFYARREFARARELGRQAIQLAPDALLNGLACWLMVADCSTGLGDLDAAIRDYQQALARLPKNSPRGDFIRRRIEILTGLKDKPARKP